MEPFAFGALGLNELRANIDAENAASLWLFSHAGFAHSAAIPGDRTSDGGPRDSIVLVKRRSPR